MLELLRIENLAIIDELELAFGPGLNVLTGETGAGKSIVLKAIDLLTGKRSSPDIIRSETEKCTVEGLFQPSASLLEEIRGLSDEAVDLIGDDEILIKRVIDRSSRSKFYINGSLTTAGFLQNLALSLIDITGQNQQQKLMFPAHHLSLLDSFGVPDELLQQISQAFDVFDRARSQLEEFQTGARERDFRLERLRAEFEELSGAELRENEREDLDAELKRLSNFERLSLAAHRLSLLFEGEGSGLDDILRALSIELDGALKLDSTFKPIVSLVEAASAELSESKLLIADYAARLDEADPERLEEIRSRIAELARLERKFRLDVSGLIKYREKIGAELAELEDRNLNEEELSRRLASARAALDLLELELTAVRQNAAKKLCSCVETELRELNMKKAKFNVAIAPRASTSKGADEIEFLLAANPGEPFQPLQKVASGGELSRILLVLKTVLSRKNTPGLQIFDEIDAGVGGAVAQIVGEKLKRLAKDSQVIIITHSPQIAALADRHFLISKTNIGKRTKTEVNLLDEPGRVQQIAAMLGGKDVTERFEESARELLLLRSKSQ